MCSPVRDPNLSFANEQLLADLTGGASAADVTVGALILDGKALTATPVNLGLDPIGLSLNGTPTPTNRLEDILKGLPDNITAISINAATRL